MKASDRVLASRYGRALFQAAASAKTEGRVQADLAAAMAPIRELAAVLHHPRVPAAEKKRRLEAALGAKVSSVALRFLNLLIDKKRFELLPLVVSDFARLVAEKNSVVKAHVRAARPLSAQDQEKLREKLRRFSGKTVELDVRQDPELIGGLVVRLGDWVLDSSLRGQLRTLREALHGN